MKKDIKVSELPKKRALKFFKNTVKHLDPKTASLLKKTINRFIYHQKQSKNRNYLSIQHRLILCDLIGISRKRMNINMPNYYSLNSTNARKGIIYVISVEETKTAKIGFCTHKSLYMRLSQYQHGSFHEIKTDVFDSNMLLESYIHHKIYSIVAKKVLQNWDGTSPMSLDEYRNLTYEYCRGEWVALGKIKEVDELVERVKQGDKKLIKEASNWLKATNKICQINREPEYKMAS